ncbi:MAG: hypothetical protein HOC70_02615 [Gammaproteobacteria bacterium]|nr:hypothetical protein [Gammaproteobacteria bacterium]MBT4492107.1 hypothetical protein [Gammaproteobacteria bacterium]
MRFLPLLFFFPFLTWAEEADTELEPATVAVETIEEEDEKQPEADQLKFRKLGSAFKDFRPSEEISADNAVSFPVDI